MTEGARGQPTLYAISTSHPVQAVRAMLDLKGIAYRQVELPPGIHAVRLRLMGFRHGTVPAMEIDGEKVQGSTAISQRVERLALDPPLFGTGPEERRAIEEAERWAERVLQPIHRRAYRLALVRRPDLRAGLAAQLPLPGGLARRLSLPQAHFLARIGGASEAQVRRHLAELPGALDHVDALMADGTIGGPRPNAADLQIGGTIWALLHFDDFRPLVARRPAARLADHIEAERPRVPAFLPAGWLGGPDRPR